MEPQRRRDAEDFGGWDDVERRGFFLRRGSATAGLELNPDEVARDRFGDWNSPEAVLNAARWTAQRREELLSAGLGIAFETVLSADDKIDFMRRARDSGYFLRLFFVGTDDPRINAARVAGRIMTGGHAVPIEKIVSRYVRSMANIKIVARIAHRVYLFDNSIDNVDARLCARIEDGALRKVYGVQPRWVESATDGLVRHPAFVDTRNFVVLPVLPKGA